MSHVLAIRITMIKILVLKNRIENITLYLYFNLLNMIMYKGKIMKKCIPLLYLDGFLPVFI